MEQEYLSWIKIYVCLQQSVHLSAVLLLFWEHLEYLYKREFALSNAALLALDAVVLALLAAACGLVFAGNLAMFLLG